MKEKGWISLDIRSNSQLNNKSYFDVAGNDGSDPPKSNGGR